MPYWNKWWRYKRRRKSRQDKLSTAAPVNTSPPFLEDGGNGLMLVHTGTWDNLPTKFDVEWKLNGHTVSFGCSYLRPSNVDPANVTVEITASNDNGSAPTITLP